MGRVRDIKGHRLGAGRLAALHCWHVISPPRDGSSRWNHEYFGPPLVFIFFLRRVNSEVPRSIAAKLWHTMRRMFNFIIHAGPKI